MRLFVQMVVQSCSAIHGAPPLRFSGVFKPFSQIDFSGLMPRLRLYLHRIDQMAVQSYLANHGGTPVRFSCTLKRFGDLEFSSFMPILRS